jgi:hypothetical protein
MSSIALFFAVCCWKLTFSNDTRSDIAARLSATRFGGSGVSNSGTAAYFAGGQINGSGTGSSSINKLTFSNDTISTLGVSIVFDTGQGYLAVTAPSNSGTAGYIGGGDKNTYITKLAYSNDSVSSFTTPAIKFRPAAGSNNGVAGYFAGGLISGVTSTTYKVSYSNDSVSTITTFMSSARSYGHAAVNSGTF